MQLHVAGAMPVHRAATGRESISRYIKSAHARRRLPLATHGRRLRQCSTLSTTSKAALAPQALRESGKLAKDDMLQHLSPLGWEHINLNGGLCLASESEDRRWIISAVGALQQRVNWLSARFFPNPVCSPTANTERARISSRWGLATRYSWPGRSCAS